MRKKNREYAQRPSDVYWASVPPEELGSQVFARFQEYQDECERKGLWTVWNNMSDVYYGYDPKTDSFSDWITEGGEEGEFLHLHVNEIASLVRNQLSLTTSDKLAFEAVAANDSPKADAQAQLARQILDYYKTEGKLEQMLNQACERMFLFGKAYVVQLWDVYAGPTDGVTEEPVYDDDGQPKTETIMSSEFAFDEVTGTYSERETQIVQPVTRQKPRFLGEIVHRVYGPQDVAIDIGCRSHDEVKWYVVKERISRWELAARFPEHRQLIIDQPTYDSDDLSRFDRSGVHNAQQTEQISVLRLLHAVCQALPNGLEAVVCGDTVLTSGPLGYARLPIHPMYAQETLDSPLGYSQVWNLLGPQSAYNASAINGITTSDAGSVPKYILDRKANVVIEDIGPTMTVLRYDGNPQLPNGGAPALMATPSFNGAHIEQMQWWRDVMQTLSGVNAVVRGQSKGKSGADNALISAQAMQYMSPYSRAFQDCARSLGLGIVEILKRFATRERVLNVVGSDEAPMVDYFTGQDLSAVSQVIVDMGDPVMRTPEGRKAIADELLSKFGPAVITPEQYMSCVSSGRYESLYKSGASEIRLIRAENEALSKGESVPVLICDNHLTHIKEHLAILSSPALRRNAALSKAVLEHVKQHEFEWTQLSQRPALLAATGTPPSPDAMMGPPAPPGAPQGPSGPNGPPGPPPGPSDAPGSAGAPKANVPGAPTSVAGVALPSMPKNPATGQPAPGGAG